MFQAALQMLRSEHLAEIRGCPGFTVLFSLAKGQQIVL